MYWLVPVACGSGIIAMFIDLPSGTSVQDKGQEYLGTEMQREAHWITSVSRAGEHADLP
jgi:hypothetical protein